MRQAMPKVAELVAMRRQELGDAHVNRCWKHGVLLGEPGWFFAREGAICVGTPFFDGEVQSLLRDLQVWEQFSAAPLLMLKSKEGAEHGTH